MDTEHMTRLDLLERARRSEIVGDLEDSILEMIEKDGIGWIWDDEEDLHRFLQGGLAAK